MVYEQCGPVVSGSVRLDACASMQYEARDDVQGVKFRTDDGEEGWTPIERHELSIPREVKW